MLRVEHRDLQSIQVRHLSLAGGPSGQQVVCWHGALKKNQRAKSLPHVVTWFKRIAPDGQLLNTFIRDIGITDLGLLQVGTIWEEGICRSQLAFEQLEVQASFDQGHWRFVSQREHYQLYGKPLIPLEVYPLPYGNRDRSELIAFQLRNGQELLVPCLEFFSRYFGRSGHVNRVLTTYPWADAEPRLYLPLDAPAGPGEWPIKLGLNAYNSDAVFLAHVKHDPYALLAAKRIYAGLDSQFQHSGGSAFLKAEPWFKGSVRLLVEGLWLDDRRFLGLRILGGSEPKGPNITVYRENPGEADTAAADDAPTSSWKGGRGSFADEPQRIANLTPNDEPDQTGDTVEVPNPSFHVLGTKRKIFRRKLPKAATRPGTPIPATKSDKHSPAERHGSASNTGRASIHTDVVLRSEGAVRDVWDALVYLKETYPEFITAVGWYSSKKKSFVMDDATPKAVRLQLFDDEQVKTLKREIWTWVYRDPKHPQPEPRGVLICYVATEARAACLFEVERRLVHRTAEDGSTYLDEEKYSGLVARPPRDGTLEDWINKILGSIRIESGVMERALNHNLGAAWFYRRSSSAHNQVAGHSTVINALGKAGIEIPRPRYANDRGDNAAEE